MTLDEKRAWLMRYCDEKACVDCTYAESKDAWCEDKTVQNLPDDMLNLVYNALNEPEPTEEVVESTPVEHDPVSHPNHYTNGGMECIDEMVLLFGVEATKAFCKLNAWKYRRRAMYKNGEEDMQKSHWYINKYKELTDGYKNMPQM